MIPATITTPQTDAPNAKISTAVAIAPYYEVLHPEKLIGYSVSSFQLENTTGATTGNYVLLAYTKNTGATIVVDGSSEIPMLKMTFRKISTIDVNSIAYYHKTAGGTVVSKLIYGTTNVLQFATATGSTIFTRPELFTVELLPLTPKYAVSLDVASAADIMNTGDTLYDDFMNTAGATKITVKASYLSTEILATVVVDPVLKNATVPNLVDGNYLFTVSRNGYLIRDITVTVAGGNLNLGDKSILAGDVYAADGIIDGSDTEMLFSAIGYGYGDAGFLSDSDLNLDGIVDGTDSEMLFTNLGYDVGVYGETVDYYN